MKYLVSFIFGAALSEFGFSINTYQFWVLILLYVIRGELK